MTATEATRTSEIPIIDIAPLADGDHAARIDCAGRIGAACRGVGFFQAIGHGVHPSHIELVFALAHEFSALPEAEKMDVAMSRATGYRGYFPLAGEITDPAFGGDPKEGFDVALAGASAAASPMAGVWPHRPATLGPAPVDRLDDRRARQPPFGVEKAVANA